LFGELSQMPQTDISLLWKSAIEVSQARTEHEKLISAVIQMAESIEADLSGNADSRRVRGRYIMVEETRIHHLLESLKKLRSHENIVKNGSVE
jgi:hypothetical protein